MSKCESFSQKTVSIVTSKWHEHNFSPVYSSFRHFYISQNNNIRLYNLSFPSYSTAGESNELNELNEFHLLQLCRLLSLLHVLVLNSLVTHTVSWLLLFCFKAQFGCLLSCWLWLMFLCLLSQIQRWCTGTETVTSSSSTSPPTRRKSFWPTARLYVFFTPIFKLSLIILSEYFLFFYYYIICCGKRVNLSNLD